MLASAIDSTNAKKSPSRLVSDSGVIEVPGLIPSPAALWVEDIAHSPYGMDQLLIEGIIHLGSQAPDRDVNDIGIRVEVDVPDLGRDRGSRQHPLSGA
jgi:hypothetical protein